MVFSGILCFIPQTYNLCLFSLFYLSLVRGLSILLTFSKNKLFVFIYFLYCFSVFNIIDFYFHLYYVLISACFGLFCAFFKASWGWELRFFFSFLMYAFIAIKNSSQHCFSFVPYFWYVLFSLSSMYALIFLETFFWLMDYLEVWFSLEIFLISFC